MSMLLETILIITGLLLVWNLFVVHYLTKWVYNFVIKYNDIPAAYVGRKIVHIFGGGITAILIPFFYEGYYELVTISAFSLAIYLFLRRRYKLMYWFQIKENMYEVNFAFAYGTILLVGILLQNVMIGLILKKWLLFKDKSA